MTALIIVDILGFILVIGLLWDIAHILAASSPVDPLLREKLDTIIVRLDNLEKLDSVNRALKDQLRVIQDIKDEVRISPSASGSQLYTRFADRLISTLKEIENALARR